MPKILQAKPGKLSLTDSFIIAGSKIATEKALAPLVGNGSYMSGASKIGIAWALNKLMGGQVSDYVGTGLTVDGTEDIMKDLLKTVGLNASSSSNGEDVI